MRLRKTIQSKNRVMLSTLTSRWLLGRHGEIAKSVTHAYAHKQTRTHAHTRTHPVGGFTNQ